MSRGTPWEPDERCDSSMDGFDDLLAPSRQILEENPFDDPFAKRSNSPDPWSSFNPSPSPTYPDNVHEAVYDHGDSNTTTGSFVSAQSEQADSHPPQEPKSIATSPPETPASTIDDDDLPLALSASRRTPGFMESIPPEVSAIPGSSHAALEAPGLETSITSDPAPFTSLVTASTHKQTAIVHTSTLPPASSPLEQPSHETITQTFASLVLGGESLGGWQTPKSPSADEHNFVHEQNSEDSDDDKPLRRRSTSSQKTVSPTTAADSSTTKPRTESGIQPVFVISVEDPQKVGDPIRSFTMYTVHTRTTSPLFQKSSFSVLRRYSDFLWLYETLSNNNPGVVVPPVPEKNTFGRFDQNFVRQRRLALEKCIQKIANHPELSKDPDLKVFLESDSFALDIKHRKAEIANERGGLMASIGQTLTGPRFYEMDDWFDRKKGYLDSLESQLRGLVKAIELVSKHRLEVAVASGEFAQAIGDLASSDVGKQLSQAFSGLADVQRTAQEVHSTQSEQDMVTITSTVDEYARLINSVRLAFGSRVRLYHAWQNADNDVRRVKQTHERNRSQGRIPPERLGASLSQIAEAERRALEAKHEFDNVSKLVKSELARFERERIEDFKDSLNQFLHGMIVRQKQIIGAWEIYQQGLLKSAGVGRPQGNTAPTASASS